MSRKLLSEETLKSDMKQNWTQGNGVYYDQFHFKIERDEYTYKLYWHGDYITETKTLDAAKVISTILLNDKIFG
jgi:hypothetical protein